MASPNFGKKCIPLFRSDFYMPPYWAAVAFEDYGEEIALFRIDNMVLLSPCRVMKNEEFCKGK